MLRLFERAAWIVGIVGLAVWAVARISGAAGTHEELARFVAVQAALHAASGPPDQSLWSPERVRAWQESQKQQGPAPLAILRIPRLGLEVPVLDGTDDWTLNRAVGHIADTPVPGADGNSGIAGHRDGFFRLLKDIRQGDDIELETLAGAEVYRVERTWIVEPEDVAVLDPTPARSITLVTCYPFYFVGSAPQRYIVRAVRVSSKEHTGNRGT